MESDIEREKCDHRQGEYVEGFKDEEGSGSGFRRELPLKQGQMVYNPEDIKLKNTMRMGTEDNTYEGIVGHSQLIKGGHQTQPKDIKGRLVKHAEHYSGLKSLMPSGETGYLNTSFFNKFDPTNSKNRYGGE